jgi:hypothetical protein
MISTPLKSLEGKKGISKTCSATCEMPVIALVLRQRRGNIQRIGQEHA